jgi:hypothetical protein
MARFVIFAIAALTLSLVACSGNTESMSSREQMIPCPVEDLSIPCGMTADGYYYRIMP